MLDWEIERERKVASGIGDLAPLFDCEGVICKGDFGCGVIAGHFKDDPGNPHYKIAYFPLSARSTAGYVMAEEPEILTDGLIWDNPDDRVYLRPTELRAKLLQGRYIELTDERALLREALHEMAPYELDELGIESLAPGPIRRDHEER